MPVQDIYKSKRMFHFLFKNAVKNFAVDALYELLCQWKLEHLYQHFQEQHITIKLLQHLTTRHIELIFHDLPVGDMTTFEINLKNWTASSDVIIETLNVQKVLQSSELSNNADPRRALFVREPICSVKEMLEDTKNGNLLLKFYKDNKSFSEEQRHLLIGTIAKYIEYKGYSCSYSDCTSIERQICTIFPTESLDYYISGKRGKLYNKIFNLKRSSKALFNGKETTTSETSETVLYVPEPDAEETVKYLRSDNINDNEFDFYWRKCSQSRFLQISKAKAIQDVLQMWPEYGGSNALQLIETDFHLKFPKASDMADKWARYEKQILHIMKTKVSSPSVLKQLNEMDLSNTESKIFALFWNLHNLFAPQLKVIEDHSGSKRKKKFSILDSQNSFALVGRSKAELDAKLNLHIMTSIHNHPLLLVIGDILVVKEILLYFNGQQYAVENVLSAVDILYKIFFVFDLEYPEESELFYNFMQCFFYDMQTKKKSAKIAAINHEITNLNLP